MRVEKKWVAKSESVIVHLCIPIGCPTYLQRLFLFFFFPFSTSIKASTYQMTKISYKPIGSRRRNTNYRWVLLKRGRARPLPFKGIIVALKGVNIKNFPSRIRADDTPTCDVDVCLLLLSVWDVCLFIFCWWCSVTGSSRHDDVSMDQG